MPRYRRYFTKAQTIFLTMVTAAREPWLLDEKCKQVVLQALRETRKHHPFNHHAHVLLHDHLHLLISPHDDVAIPRLVGSFKQCALASLPHLSESPRRMWQRRYYDHIIRDPEDFQRHLDYVHFNPVKHGLVTHASAWQWSSFSTWQSRGAYTEDWGICEPTNLNGMTE